ncbi:MAG: hypothetical protein NW237_08750 [Cyanobacteriota bacterium]|nr:hypothetical protein [Cyanobacteriota bacterium]
MLSGSSPDPVRQKALAALTAELTAQGHPSPYAQQMAAALIFQADLDLCSAQLARLLAWLKEQHHQIYPDALALVNQTREEFERRVQNG